MSGSTRVSGILANIPVVGVGLLSRHAVTVVRLGLSRCRASPRNIGNTLPNTAFRVSTLRPRKASKLRRP